MFDTNIIVGYTHIPLRCVGIEFILKTIRHNFILSKLGGDAAPKIILKRDF
jgi:hypothetical protein